MCIPLELALLPLWIALGFGQERRSHFWARFALASLGLPCLMAGLVAVVAASDGAAGRLTPLLLLPGCVSLVLVPSTLYRRSDSSSGPSGPDDGGPGPDQPPPSPSPPSGGVPLPDAEQATVRVRDHDKPSFDGPARRRPDHRRERTTTPPDRRAGR